MADEKTLDLILRQARSHGDFSDRPVPEEALRAAHDLMKWGPTSANRQPMRVLYLRSKESREKLRPALGPTNLEKTELTAFRNGTLQGGYFLLALRAVGLDCGAMSGFDHTKADAAFFPAGRCKSNFLVNIGFGTGKGLPPRDPRFTFDEACRII